MSYEYVTHQEECEETGLILKIIQDPDPIDPRKDYCEASTLCCDHGRYDLGDEDGHEKPATRSVPAVIIAKAGKMIIRKILWTFLMGRTSTRRFFAARTLWRFPCFSTITQESRCAVSLFRAAGIAVKSASPS